MDIVSAIISFRTIITDSRPSGVGDVSIGFMPVYGTLVVNQTSASVIELKIERAVGSNPTLPTNDVS